MVSLDVFTIFVASTLSARAPSMVITGSVKVDDMDNTIQKLDLLHHSTQKFTCSSRRLHRLDCANSYVQCQRLQDHNLA